MELVLSTFTLGVGGSESYLLTVAEQLQHLGHDVTVHAMEVDDSADAAASRGLRVARGERHLPRSCDAVLAQDSVVSLFHARRYPRAPQVFVCHSDYFDAQLPPQLPGVTQALVVLSDRLERRVRALALDQEIVRLRQPVDLGRFAPRDVAREGPRRVLVMSGYAQEGRQRMIDDACAELGLECDRIGLFTAMDTSPELAMTYCDIVVGKARVIVEAMACGRAAYVWDANGGDGWVTPDRYELLEADNFGGQAEAGAMDGGRLRRDLSEYNPAMGVANRDLAVRYHSASGHAAELVSLFERLGPCRDRSQTPLRELERVARTVRSFETRAFHLVRENDALRARLAQLDPGFVPGVARPGLAPRLGRRSRLGRMLALGRESVRDRLRWRVWRLRTRLTPRAAPDPAGENEGLRPDATADDPLTPRA